MTKAGLRRLLLQVHPDVLPVALRVHNERSLKTLLSALRGGDGPAQSVAFHLRDGGHTGNVHIDPNRIEHSMKVLLIAAKIEAPPPTVQEQSKRFKARNKRPAAVVYPFSMDEELDKWWAQRDDYDDAVGLVFAQNRVRFIHDYAFRAKVGEDWEKMLAVKVMRDTLQYYVEFDTIRRLHSAPGNAIDFVLFARNFDDLQWSGNSLYAPLTASPETLGKIIEVRLADLFPEERHARAAVAAAATVNPAVATTAVGALGTAAPSL